MFGDHTIVQDNYAFALNCKTSLLHKWIVDVCPEAFKAYVRLNTFQNV